ncbi:MAG: hypothetical protein HPAVJP_2170 [Candidatus Hepatoplasma vulgare]|nr:MAG: hypothetical protein HPAVJP_2170 [Candidatus Hepatoplasma sp.]
MARGKKSCQSCGMPLKYDKNGPALEIDGTPSEKYCSNCYKDGEFVCKDCKIGDIQKKNGDVMKKMHYPNFLIKYFNKRVSKLERWQTKEIEENKLETTVEFNEIDNLDLE